MDPILRIAHARGLVVIGNCPGHGAEYKDARAGWSATLDASASPRRISAHLERPAVVDNQELQEKIGSLETMADT
jgi:dTDP-4-amino-4,6-dideoxygalactose transaminase